MGFDTKQRGILNALRSVYTQLDESRGADWEAAREEVLEAQNSIEEAITHLQLAARYAPALEGVLRSYMIGHLEAWAGDDENQVGNIGDILQRIEEYSNPSEDELEAGEIAAGRYESFGEKQEEGPSESDLNNLWNSIARALGFRNIQYKRAEYTVVTRVDGEHETQLDPKGIYVRLTDRQGGPAPRPLVQQAIEDGFKIYGGIANIENDYRGRLSVGGGGNMSVHYQNNAILIVPTSSHGEEKYRLGDSEKIVIGHSVDVDNFRSVLGSKGAEERNESVSKIRSILGLRYIKESKHSLDTFNIGDQIEFSANGRIVSDATVYDVDDTFAYAVSSHIDGMRGRAHFFEIPLEPHDFSDGDVFAGYDDEEDAGSDFGQYDFQHDKIFIELKTAEDINIFLVDVSAAKQAKVANVLDANAGSGI